MNAIDGGLPLCVAVILTGMPVMLLVLYPVCKILCFDKVSDDEWDNAQTPPRSSLSRDELHDLLLKRAAIWGRVWTAGGVILPILVWANTEPHSWRDSRDTTIEFGLANFCAGLAFLAIIHLDRRLNAHITGADWYILRRHVPGFLYFTAVALLWIALSLAA